MFKIVFLSMTLVLSSANAQLGQQMLNQVKKINEQKKSQIPLGSMVAGCTDCLEKPNINKQCWAEMCDAKNLKNYLEFEKEAAEKAGQSVPGEKEFREAAIRSEDNSFMREMSPRLKIAAESWDGAIPKSMIFLFATAEMKSWLKGHQIAPKLENGKYVVDVDKLKAIGLVLTDDQLSIVVDYHNEIYSKYSGLSDTSLTASMRLKMKYPNKSFQEAVKLEITEVKVLRKKGNIFDSIGLSGLDADPIDEIILDIESGEDVSEDAVAELLDSAQQSKVLIEMFSPEGSASKILSRVPSSSWEAKLKDPTLRKKMIADIEKEFVSDDSEKMRVQKSADLCIAQVRANYAKLPTIEQIVEAKKTIELVKSKIKDKVLPKYSEHSSKMLSKVLDEIDFNMPPDKDTYLKNLSYKFRRDEKTKSKIRSQALKTIKPESLLPLIAYSVLSEDEQEQAIEIPSLCKTNHSALSDAAISMSGAITVSYTSIVSLGLGQGVIAHEIGHVMDGRLDLGNGSSAESTMNQMMTRICLNKKHSPSLTNYSGEDFSDLVAGLVTTENMACIFPEGSHGSLEKPLVNQSANDPHSSEYFRALHIEQTQRGSLPPACNKMLVERSSPADFGSCLK